MFFNRCEEECSSEKDNRPLLFEHSNVFVVEENCVIFFFLKIFLIGWEGGVIAFLHSKGSNVLRIRRNLERGSPFCMMSSLSLSA